VVGSVVVLMVVLTLVDRTTDMGVRWTLPAVTHPVATNCPSLPYVLPVDT